MSNKITPIHWNYFLALEQDLENTSRYIEFHESNFKTYSVELARIYLAACSEIDVVLKQYCVLLDPTSKADAIKKYQKVIKAHKPHLTSESVYIPRYNLSFRPWDTWMSGDDHPAWWKAYNKVKHHRHTHFTLANLENVINALAGLMVVAFHYYMIKSVLQPGREGEHTSNKLIPLLHKMPGLLRFHESKYPVVIGG